ncbi:glucosamine-6-phosphate isomerase [Ilyonectria robusta]
MRLIIRDDPEAAALQVANHIISRINTFAPTASKPFVLGLPTGSSPLPVYRNIITACRDGRVSFSNVVTFNMDEYVGLPQSHPESYHSFMHTNFFSQVDIPLENVNILDGNARDLQAECDKYEERIKAAGGIALFLGGVGSDGHIAFNEPGSSLVSRTRVKTLAYDTVLANARFFGGNMDQVPRMALTVGVQTVMDAREVVIIATGVGKALAVKKSIEEGVSHMYTLSCLQMHPSSMIVVDEDATLELQVKTVRYFKSIEPPAKETQGMRDLKRLRTSSLVSPPQTPQSKFALERDALDDGELSPDSMSSRIAPFH